MRSREAETWIPSLLTVGLLVFVALGIVVGLTSQGVVAGLAPSSKPTSDASPNVEVVTAQEGVPNSCPITVPGEDAFTPAWQAPKELPSVYASVWYGSPALWTKIDQSGEVWRDLPVGADGSLTQKWLWWSDHLSSGDSAEIIVTADHVDGLAHTIEVRGSGGASSSPTSPSLGTFLVTGFELPGPGCWRITGSSKDTSLSFVVWVADD